VAAVTTVATFTGSPGAAFDVAVAEVVQPPEDTSSAFVARGTSSAAATSDTDNNNPTQPPKPAADRAAGVTR
jgi:hypothetical protein